jgi:hypothetical protein
MTRGHMQMFASRRSCLWDRLFWSIDSAACVGWFNDHPRFWRVVTKIQPQWQSSKSNPNLYARRLVEHLQSHLSRHGVLWWRSKRSHPGLKEEDRRNRALSEDQTPAGPHESRSAWWIYSCWGSKYWVRIVLSILDDIVYIYIYYIYMYTVHM